MNVKIKNTKKDFNDYKPFMYTCRNTLLAKENQKTMITSLYEVGSNIILIADMNREHVENASIIEYRQKLFEGILYTVDENATMGRVIINSNNSCFGFLIFENECMNLLPTGCSFNEFDITLEMEDSEIIRRMMPFIDFTEIRSIREEKSYGAGLFYST